MARKKPLEITVKGLKWKCYFQTKATYARANGSDSEGCTYTKTREIYFNLHYFTPGIARHELMHAYFASSGTISGNLSADQIEEMACELLELHGPEMMVLVDEIVTYALDGE